MQTIIRKICHDLDAQGYAVLPGFLPDGLTEGLLTDLEMLDRAGRMSPAGTGRGGGHAVRADIRNDQTLWLDGGTPPQQDFMAIMEAVRQGLNEALMMGLFEYEAHYARYEAGGFYKRHVDALRGERNRVVSTVTYLTRDWMEADEGHLVLYDAQDREMTRVLPVARTLAVFLSEEIPHEVLPPRRARCSIAGWFRCRSQEI